jgi:hypothetical protein
LEILPLGKLSHPILFCDLMRRQATIVACVGNLRYIVETGTVSVTDNFNESRVSV